MPCNKLAVATAQMQVTFQPMLHSGLALEALGHQYEAVLETLGKKGQEVSVCNDTTYQWGRPYSSRHYGVYQGMPFNEVAIGARNYVDLCARAGALRLYMDGRMEMRDGWDLPSPLTGPEAQAILQAMSAYVAPLALYAVQNAVIAALVEAGAKAQEIETGYEGVRTFILEVAQ